MSQVSSSQEYARLVKLAAMSTFVGALLMIALKLFAWFTTGASAMLASASDSILDLFASSLNLIILRYALMPPDKQHQFGHGKAENLAGLLQSAFIMGSAVLLVINGVDRVIEPVVVEQVSVGIWVTLISLVITFIVVAIQAKVIQRTKSVAIQADALHYKSDVILNLGVIATLLLTEYVAPQIDGVFTLLVGVYLLYGGYTIIINSIRGLMDEELPAETVDKIETLIKEEAEVIGFHALRTRQAGPVIFIQLHLELSGEISLACAHKIGDRVQARLLAHFPGADVIIHLDPK